ncbi:T9SS type B sorting domain-containing protein [Tenacibaculum tangerinum]|uniref:T9SS type B sorting domain-containing protein n=1 Tax=Tenacibaculum tangerinum TaxID=3038772 RepID=A0ABY8L2E1_9FLAO|nr:T9SS type B sorting domain-containing protein [Tenacibaculum tangerinum]WGH75611.1 T9SS type B sorting domain-containing protein [Tenacibaculum tangerinum]
MNKLLVLFLFLYSLFCFSQNETNHWFFGDKAGLNFSYGGINVTNTSQMETPAGCTSISDTNGNLLFYSDGKTIWNRNHEVMEGGTDLGDKKELFQNSIIIPKPNSTEIYYLLYMKSTLPSGTFALFLAEIEISSSYPNGIVKRRNSLLKSLTTERITAVHHKNGKSIWVITLNKSGAITSPITNISAFEIDETGVVRPPKNNTIQEDSIDKIGAMKISPDGSKLAISDYNNSFIYVYNFDTSSGNVSFNTRIFTDIALLSPTYPYGLGFSPNSKILYYTARQRTDSSILVQYFFDNPFPSNPLFSEKTPIFVSYDYSFGALQLANNGKVYVAMYTKDDPIDEINGLSPVQNIGFIDSPDQYKLDCDYNHMAIQLDPGLSIKGLPSFIQSYFRNRILTEDQCVFDTFNFSLDSYAPINSVTWEFGDGSISNEMSPEYAYTTAGEYTVTATININNKDVKLYKKVTVFPLPKLIPNQEIVQCDDDNDGVNLFNLNAIGDKISTDDTLTYEFYTNLADAENNTNQIQDPENFYNESNPQTIYTRATSLNGCSNIESFSIEALFRPALTIPPITACKDVESSVNEDVGFFDLRVKRSQIVNNLGLSKLEKISFFASFTDAQKSINILPYEYISNSTTIWVKIENENGCFGISPIELIVNSPQINLEDNYTICISPSDHPPITLTADSSYDRFEWKDENNTTIATSNSFALTKAGTFSLTIFKTINGVECSTSKSFTVNYPPPPKILNVDVTVQSETENIVYVSVNGDSNYEFSLDDTTYFGNGASHSFYNVQPGIATIYIKDLNKCEPSITASASIIGYPKFLTPNSDGFNDYWKVYGVSTNFFKEIDIKIFNRFGKVVYVINDKNSDLGWDGTYNNIQLPTNDYWFHAKLKDLNDNTIDKKGHFTLKRN